MVPRLPHPPAPMQRPGSSVSPGVSHSFSLVPGMEGWLYWAQVVVAVSGYIWLVRMFTLCLDTEQNVACILGPPRWWWVGVDLGAFCFRRTLRVVTDLWLTVELHVTGPAVLDHRVRWDLSSSVH